MKVENTPGAYGFLAGLLVLLLGMFANTSCAHTSKLTSRGLTARYIDAVEIEAVCVKGSTAEGMLVGWHGSGVVVSRTRVLTANHVANMRDMTCVFQTKTIDGRTRMMQPLAAMPSLDLASLELVDGEKPFDASPVAYGKVPEVGDRVCAATGNPWRGHKCGEVQLPGNLPGDVQFLIIVEPGNSGSGVYNDAGELIGIVTHKFTCSQSTQTCGGKAASLAGHVAELLP